MNNTGKFRFSYFTKQYEETFAFYQDRLGLKLAHSWDRSEKDKGALFEAGTGLIEILHHPHEMTHFLQGLDYRDPQGVFMCIQVSDVEALFEKFMSRGIPFQQELSDQSWGHRTFTLIEPNDLLIYFYEERY